MTEITPSLLTEIGRGGGARRGRAALRSLAPLALMAAIFYLSAQPAVEELSWWTIAARKLGHLGGYAALTLLWTWALAPAVRSPLPVAIAISVGYAITDELHQSFVPGRHGTAVDVLIDTAGAGLAAVAVQRFRSSRARWP